MTTASAPPAGDAALADEPGRWLDRRVFLRNLPGVIAIVLVWVAAALIFPELIDRPAFLIASGLALTSLTVSFLVPWERVPSWIALIPPLLLIGAVGALAFEGVRVSIIALVPVIDLARHHGRRGAVAGVVAALGASQAEVLFAVTDLTRDGVMRLVVISIVFVTVATVVTALEERAQARRRLLARQGRALSEAYARIDVDRALLQGVVSAITVGVVVLDDDGRVVHANEAVERFGEVPLVPGLDVAELGAPPEREREPGADVGADLPTYLRRTAQGETVTDETRWWSLADGTQVALRANIVRVTSPRSRGLYRVLVLEDLTTEVSAVREREDFMGAVSHELRTPLTSVLGYLEMVIEDTETAETSRSRLKIAERNVRRLDSLVEDLLADAAARHAFSDPEIEQVSVGRLVRDSVQVLTPRAERAGVTLESAVESGLVVRGDARGIGQVMDNLLSNAVKYSDDGGTVVVVAQREGDEVVVTVADDGIGISEEDQEHLFERFFRAESVRMGERRGTGLGLHLVRELVHAHGGEVEVHSDLGEGTQITVRLPYAGSVPDPHAVAVAVPPAGALTVVDPD